MLRSQRVAICFLLSTFCTAGYAQTLAHKNWAGSGLVVAPWWVGAELYALDPISFKDSNGDGFGDLNGITSKLDYLSGLGVDALLLSPMPLQAAGTPFDKAYGTEDDFGRLVEEATRRRIRILVDLPLSPSRTSAETLGTARFWLTRGVAGLRLTSDRNSQPLNPAERAERIRELRRLCAQFAGQRVLMGEAEAPIPIARSRHDASRAANSSSPTVELILAPIPERGSAVAGLRAQPLRAALISAEKAAGETSTPVLVTDAAEEALRSVDRLGDGAHNLAMAKVVAATLLGSRGAPMLYFGQELGMSGTGPAPMQWGGEHGFTSGTPWVEMGPNAATASVTAEDADPDSLLAWYRKLGLLRRTNAALRQGTEDMLQAGDADAVAWVRRARLGEGETPDVVVVVNCSARFVSVSVAEGVGVRVLKTLAATYAADAAVSTHGIAVPPFGVFIGEVQRKAGLETTPDPPRRRR